MHTVTSILILLLSTSAFASGEPDARLSIIRKLGAGGERGTETTELVCQDKRPTCSVKRFRRHAIVESGTLSHKQGIEVISRLQKDMQQAQEKSTLSNEEANLSWSLNYHASSSHGSLSAHSSNKALLSLMKAEANIWANFR